VLNLSFWSAKKVRFDRTFFLTDLE
jgi:hypothetical protein